MISTVELDACVRRLMALDAFIAIVIMAFYMEPKPHFAESTYDIIELFAGRARITRLAQFAGYSAI
ncbi:unnamed protein product, partial [Symbiodinium necroappetens]